ncbi:hypothetical protein ACFWU5_28850 [Nocardia sp. NPDC058640]|uniref:hypothetical protein n=1 Tax=Nocardia sp. NPDC058640 TaxID=3346571 RepID=UPI003665DD5B
MAYYAPAPASPTPRKFSTSNGFRVVFWVLAAVTMAGLFAAMWCASLPGGLLVLSLPEVTIDTVRDFLAQRHVPAKVVES